MSTGGLSNSGAGQHREVSYNPEDWVYPSGKKNPITDSLRVAKAFGKYHKNVLRAFDQLACDAEFSRLNFVPAEYTDGRGKIQRAVLMTRQGFTFLVMGFTGKKAAQFKQQYIEQFERMEAELRGVASTLPPLALSELTKREVQVDCTKQAARQVLRTSAGKNGLIQHHRGIMRCLTGKTPTEYVKAAVATGLRVASFSGRELLRRLEPGKAATAAFLDDQLRRGKSLEQLKAARLHEVLPQAFTAMLAAGIVPTELPSAS